MDMTEFCSPDNSNTSLFWVKTYILCRFLIFYGTRIFVFQDKNLTWSTSSRGEGSFPDLTLYFEQTVLIWIPSLVLLFLSLFEFGRHWRSKSKRIPSSLLLIVKCVGVWSLILLHTVHLSLTFNLKESEQVSRAERYGTIVRIATYVRTARV